MNVASGYTFNINGILKINATNFKINSGAIGNNNMFYVGTTNDYMSYSPSGGLTVKGKIYATSGEFSASLMTGSISADRIKGGTITGCELNIGNNTCTISSTGILSATGASISGAITATSMNMGALTYNGTTLQLGPWTIDSTKIYGGSGAAYTEIYPGGIFCEYRSGSSFPADFGDLVG
jgi:hypothetical protein